jgi:hypothetical protein
MTTSTSNPYTVLSFMTTACSGTGCPTRSAKGMHTDVHFVVTVQSMVTRHFTTFHYKMSYHYLLIPCNICPPPHILMDFSCTFTGQEGFTFSCCTLLSGLDAIFYENGSHIYDAKQDVTSYHQIHIITC